jgi:hypothetical protein
MQKFDLSVFDLLSKILHAFDEFIVVVGVAPKTDG